MLSFLVEKCCNLCYNDFATTMENDNMNKFLMATALSLMMATPSFARIIGNECMPPFTMKEIITAYGVDDVTVSKFKLRKKQDFDFLIIVRYGNLFDVFRYTKKGCRIKGFGNTEVDDDYIKDLEKIFHIKIFDSRQELIFSGKY
jgi:hypothetical protein